MNYDATDAEKQELFHNPLQRLANEADRLSSAMHRELARLNELVATAVPAADTSVASTSQHGHQALQQACQFIIDITPVL